MVIALRRSQRRRESPDSPNDERWVINQEAAIWVREISDVRFFPIRRLLQGAVLAESADSGSKPNSDQEV